MIQVFSYEAGTGDLLRIRYKHTEEECFHNVFIDGGKKASKVEKSVRRFSEIVEEVIDSEEDILEAVFVTHWDADHIDGIEEWMLNPKSKKAGTLYLNSGVIDHAKIPSADHSPGQAKKVAEELISLEKQGQIKWVDSVVREAANEKGEHVIEIGGARLFMISPGMEQLEKLKNWDGSVAEAAAKHSGGVKIPGSFEEEAKKKLPAKDQTETNGSSIAFLFEYEEKRMAFLGDAFPKVCEDGLKELGFSKKNPCRVAFVKIPHHGSARNYSKRLYEILATDTYMLCTNGPVNKGNMLPNKCTLARLMYEVPHERDTVTFLCDYSWWNNGMHAQYFFTEQEENVLEEINEHGLCLPYAQKDGREMKMELINSNRIKKNIILEDGLEICRS